MRSWYRASWGAALLGLASIPLPAIAQEAMQIAPWAVAVGAEPAGGTFAERYLLPPQRPEVSEWVTLPEWSGSNPISCCFDAATPPSDAELAAMERLMQGFGPRYNVAGSWSSGPNTPRTLTWSFIPDGTMIPRAGDIAAESDAPSTLFATMDGKFGGQRSVWVNYIQGCFDRYAAVTGIRYVQVRYQNRDWDDGAAFPNSGGAAGLRGDIRIGMHYIDGNSHILAYNRYPGGGGDMVLDSADSWEDNTGAFNRLRNVFSHEHGHGLGLAHVCPLSHSKLMEPIYTADFDGPQHDDILALQYNYGDTYEPNNSAAQATVLNILNPLALETTWGTLGAYPYINPPAEATAVAISSGDVDWFRGSVAVAVPVTVSVTPRGTTYDSSLQNGDSSCASGNLIDTLHQARLRIQLLGADGTTVLGSATAAAAGQGATINFVTVPAGNFYVVISSPDAPARPQAYTWSITSGSASPPNDNCSAAAAIGFGSYAGSNYGSHRDGDGYCDPVGTVGGADVWYRFTPTCSGQVRIDTCGSSIPTVLSVFPGTQPCPPAINSALATSCYTTNGNPCSPQSAVTFNAVGGSSYLVRVAGLWIGNTAPPQYYQGAYTLNVTSLTTIANDDCAAAAVINEGQTINASTCGANPSLTIPISCGTGAAGTPDVWYRYTPNCSGHAGFELCGSGYDTVVGVYSGTCGNLTEIACNDDNSYCSNILSSYVEADVTAGQSYYIRVTGFNGRAGAFSLYVSLLAPANQTCANATAIAPNGVYEGTTCLAASFGTTSCVPGSSPAVWFKYTAACTGNLQLDTCGSGFDTVLTAYRGTCTAPVEIACDDDSGLSGPCPRTVQSYLSVPVVAGTSYIVRLSGYNGVSGHYVLHAYFQRNDTCGNAAAIAAGSTAFSTTCADPDGAASCGTSNASPSVWYAYTPACGGTMVLDTCGTAYDTVLSLYSGNCLAPVEIACSDDDAPCSLRASKITAPATAGQTYLIRVSGYNGASGTGTLNIVCHPPCPADYNGDFALNVQDIFDFLNGWFSAAPQADFNHVNGLNVQDIFDFLAAWFAGC